MNQRNIKFLECFFQLIKKKHLCVRALPSFHQNYLSSRGKSWRDVRQEALESLEQGKYQLTGEPLHLNSAAFTFKRRIWFTAWLSYIHIALLKKKKTVKILAVLYLYLSDWRISENVILCYCCGLRAFKELAYKYRQSIPSSELPGQKRMKNLLLFFLVPFSFFSLVKLPKIFLFAESDILSPVAVTSRPDCYWGRNCRTQVKAHHAM